MKIFFALLIFLSNFAFASCYDTGTVVNLGNQSYMTYTQQIVKISQQIVKINKVLLDISLKIEKNIDLMVNQTMELNKEDYVNNANKRFIYEKLNNIESAIIDLEGVK